MNDDRGTVRVEDRERAGGQRDASCHGLERRVAFRVGDEIWQIAHVERMIHVRVHVAGGAGIEVAAGGGESGRFALADGVQVHAVGAGLEAADVHRDFHGLGAGHVLHVVAAGRLRVDFAQLDGAFDAFAGDRGFRGCVLTRGDSNCAGGDDGQGQGQ